MEDPRQVMQLLHEKGLTRFSADCIEKGELPEKLPDNFSISDIDLSAYSKEPRHGSSPFDERKGYTLKKSPLALSKLKSDDELKQADLVVVIMGPTGAGKSRLIREATGYDVDVSDSLKSGTLLSQFCEYQMTYRLVQAHQRLKHTTSYTEINMWP